MKFLWSLSALTVCLVAASGCAVLQPDATVTAEKSPLKTLRPSVDAIQLEVVFVERPIGDPLLGKRLWSQLDQVSTVSAATLASLDRTGFRFGVSPTDPPRALQAALGLTGDISPRNDTHAFNVNGRSYSRRSGEELTIDTWSSYPRCEMVLDRAGESEVSTYENARCVFRVKVERTQDGWARLEFVPEVHHGEMRLRSVPDEFSWTTTSSQLVDPQFDQRFEVELNVGEMIVLGADGDEPRSLGQHFFRGGTTNSKLQRLLVIRLADMQRVDPVYEEPIARRP